MAGIGSLHRTPIGDMRHRITVQRSVDTLDAARQKVESFTNWILNEPASFQQVSGGETVRGRQIEPGVTALFKVNHRDGYEVTHRVVFNGQSYGIVRIDTPKGIERFMWLHCKAVV